MKLNIPRGGYPKGIVRFLAILRDGSLLYLNTKSVDRDVCPQPQSRLPVGLC